MAKQKVTVIRDIMEENSRISDALKQYFSSIKHFIVNIMGSPGCGKTSVLIELIHYLSDFCCYVIEADIQSDIDTQKLCSLGIPAYQINTGGACHLDAVTIRQFTQTPWFAGRIALPNNAMSPDSAAANIGFIENIGNLICPAEFDIGDHCKIVICSVSEGSDKPYKYPLIFQTADAVILNKCDLKQYSDFDDDFFRKGVYANKPLLPIFEASCKTKEGFKEIADFVVKRVQSTSFNSGNH